jgi:hypothetical protein
MPGFIFSDVMMNMVDALVKQRFRNCCAHEAINPGAGLKWFPRPASQTQHGNSSKPDEIGQAGNPYMQIKIVMP